MPPTVVITDSTYPDADLEREVLEAIDAEVITADAQSPEAVIESARGADALLNQETELTRAVFEALDDLQAVARYGVGVDNIDVEAATDHGVSVLNVPSYCEDEVATHALSLLLALVRNVPSYDQQVKNGGWDWTSGRPINRLTGKTLGFVAFGSIPRQLAEKAAGFDLEYIAYDPYQSRSELADAGVEKVDFEELLERADVVSIHAPLTDETHHLFDESAIGRLEDDALLINVARGPVVDEEALATALRNGELGGAGLDVMPTEPPESSPLFDLDNAVLTPHVAWYSEESIVDLRTKAARALVKVLQGERPPSTVNDTPT